MTNCTNCSPMKPNEGPKKIIGWRAIYTEGRKYSSKHEPGWIYSIWENLPDDGVLEIMLYENHRRPDGGRLRRIMDGSDWYMLAVSDEGQPMYINNSQSMEDNIQRYYNKDVEIAARLMKRGKWTDEETAYTAQRRVWQEIDF